jgi:hypothetical protein
MCQDILNMNFGNKKRVATKAISNAGEIVKYEIKSIIKHSGSYAGKVFKTRTAHSRNR